MNWKRNRSFVTGLLLLLLAVPSFGQGTVGEQVTRFEFADCRQAAEWVSGYMRNFFTNRIDIGPAVFPREYLAIADCWLNDAQRDGNTIQEFTRQNLLDDRLDDEGYVLSRQHGATSHDHGWPFPHWSQVYGAVVGAAGWKEGNTEWKGVTAGWHFYDNQLGWEHNYDNARRGAPEHFSTEATKRWGIQGLKSLGVDHTKNAWKLKTVGGAPVLTSPEGVVLDTFNCPFVQIRWNVDGGKPEGMYIEWLREGDSGWSAERQMEFSADWIEGAGRSVETGMFHSIIPLHKHPQWNGKIARIRFCLTDGSEVPETFFVRSIFTHWDTRHLVNNAIYIKAAFEYFRWTGDIDFLRKILPKLRIAMRYMMEEGHGQELNHIRCTWPGHDGRPGYTVHADGSKTFHPGHGKGGNYWDLLPLGWDDMYTTTHYYAALLAMAQLEEIVPGGLEATSLRKHAANVKRVANKKFFDKKAGRFVACIDADGVPHDYGFTFVNLEAIHYGIASKQHARRIMSWIDGKRKVAGDTSTGTDIYAHRLAPRATTKRNIEWYFFGWTNPEWQPFGGQVQDGGAVLGFSFYDIMSRIKTLGTDNAWNRLMEIREWDEEVAAYCGYRKYYGDGKGTTTLQGGGPPGGIGIDNEFTESSMLSAVVPLGFMGLRPDGQVLHIEPNLPKACPKMTVRNVLYQGVPMDISVSAGWVEIVVHRDPTGPLQVVYDGKRFDIDSAQAFRFPIKRSRKGEQQ